MNARHAARIAVTALLLLGCASTETGNPPAQPESGLDVARIMFIVLPNMGDPGFLSGEADALLAAGGTLRITAVETELDTFVVPIGTVPPAFSASLPASVSGWLRLQVIAADGQRLAPLDVLASALTLGGVEPLPNTLQDCLTVPTDVALGGAGVARIRLRNDCAEPIAFDAPSVRLGLVEVDPAGSFELRAGLDFVISSPAPLTDSDEDVVILRAGGGRRAITVTR